MVVPYKIRKEAKTLEDISKYGDFKIVRSYSQLDNKYSYKLIIDDNTQSIDLPSGAGFSNFFDNKNIENQHSELLSRSHAPIQTIFKDSLTSRDDRISSQTFTTEDGITVIFSEVDRTEWTIFSGSYIWKNNLTIPSDIIEFSDNENWFSISVNQEAISGNKIKITPNDSAVDIAYYKNDNLIGTNETTNLLTIDKNIEAEGSFYNWAILKNNLIKQNSKFPIELQFYDSEINSQLKISNDILPEASNSLINIFKNYSNSELSDIYSNLRDSSSESFGTERTNLGNQIQINDYQLLTESPIFSYLEEDDSIKYNLGASIQSKAISSDFDGQNISNQEILLVSIYSNDNNQDEIQFFELTNRINITANLNINTLGMIFLIQKKTNQDEKKLATPTNLLVSNNILSWDPVYNATKYIICIGDNEYGVLEDLENRYIEFSDSYIQYTSDPLTVVCQNSKAISGDDVIINNQNYDLVVPDNVP